MSVPEVRSSYSEAQLCQDTCSLRAAWAQGCRYQALRGPPAPWRGVEATSDHCSLSGRLQTEPEPGPPPQGSWAVDGYSTPPGGTEDSVSCMGECCGGGASSWGGGVPLFTVGRPPHLLSLSFGAQPRAKLSHLGGEHFKVRRGEWPGGRGHSLTSLSSAGRVVGGPGPRGSGVPLSRLRAWRRR